MVTQYTVNAHPDENSSYHDCFAITVEYRGHGRWAVCRPKRCLSNEGHWDFEPTPWERDDEWLDTHRFNEPTALRLAVDQAERITVNGMTARGHSVWEGNRQRRAGRAS